MTEVTAKMKENGTVRVVGLTDAVVNLTVDEAYIVVDRVSLVSAIRKYGNDPYNADYDGVITRNTDDGIFFLIRGIEFVVTDYNTRMVVDELWLAIRDTICSFAGKRS